MDDSNQNPIDLMQNQYKVAEHSKFMVPVTPEEICQIIQALHNKVSRDAYGMSAQLLKRIGNVISPLTILFNRCLEDGYFPQELKVGRILRVFIGGDETSLSNYRPISILPAISKIL